MRWLIFACVCIGLYVAYETLSVRTYEYSGQSFLDSGPASGLNPVNQPLQKNLPVSKSFKRGRFEFHLIAEFHVAGLVLSATDYNRDEGSLISPIDLALGWGIMSNPDVVSELGISQSRRFYHYRWSDAPPAPAHQIAANSANMHMVPANQDVEATLRKVRRGDRVRLSGFLMNAYRDDGWRWLSSMTRNDQGDGACELVYVERAEIL